MAIELRDYQLEAVTCATKAMREGKTPLLVLPTGAGKTVTFGEVARRHLNENPGSRVLVLAHRIELLHQARGTMHRVLGDVPVGIEAAGEHAAPTDRIICASTATLARPARRPDGVGLVIVDEAHRIQSTTHGAIVGDYRSQGAGLLGVTATPERLDGKPLKEFFDVVAYKMGLAEAIERNFLVPVKCVGIGETVDTDGLRMTAGDYSPGGVETRLEPLCDRIADGVARTVGPAPGIIFAATVRSAVALSDALNRAGVNTRVVVGSTPAQERARALSDYMAGRVQAISSVAALIEGFDAPATQWVLMARPTTSKTLYRQAVGRAMRPAPGKSEAWLIDLFGSAIELSVAGRKRLLEGRAKKTTKRPQRNAADLFDDADDLVDEIRADMDAERLAKARLAGRRGGLALASRYVWATGAGGTPVLKVGDAAWVALLSRPGGRVVGAYLGPHGKKKLGEWGGLSAGRDAVEDAVYDNPPLRRYTERVARAVSQHDRHRAEAASEANAVFRLS